MILHEPCTIRDSYDTDLTDKEWEIVEPHIPSLQSNTTTGGRPPKYSRREVLNAIFYVARTGCAWRLLPHDFPKWKTVYEYFRAWDAAGVFERMNGELRKQVRRLSGKRSCPTAGIIDSQSVKTVANIGFSGYDAGKNVKGRKRHIIVDTLGLLLAVVVGEASAQDRSVAEYLLCLIATHFKKIKVIFADQVYAGKLVEFIGHFFRFSLSIVPRPLLHTFRILPKRWIVERTFGWLSLYRRLSKDYERYPRTSEAFIYVAMSNLMVTRLARGF